MKKISVEEYLIAIRTMRKYLFIDIYNEEYIKANEICKLYKKQNRFIPFLNLNIQYRNHIKFGKFIRISKRIILINLVLYLPFLIFILIYNINRTFILIDTVFLIVYTLLMEIFDKNYKKLKEKYDYNIINNPNFKRIQKFKRILK